MSILSYNDKLICETKSDALVSTNCILFIYKFCRKHQSASEIFVIRYYHWYFTWTMIRWDSFLVFFLSKPIKQKQCLLGSLVRSEWFSFGISSNNWIYDLVMIPAPLTRIVSQIPFVNYIHFSDEILLTKLTAADKINT